MADPFTPKFADLVRNATTTVGTGSFVLGPPANGFTGFMAALKPGDSFYYSAIGVDRPSEREVGRGTLLSNGTITRQPINGVLTNFSSGTKTIALVAAAEWFQNVQAGSGAAGPGQPSAATRDELSQLSAASPAVMLRETGREGLFVFDPADHSASVARDPAQGVYVPPASAPTGASGAWVRSYDGHLNAAWFGGTPGADLAPVMRNLLTFIGNDAATAFIPPSDTPYLWNSKVDWAGALSLVSQPSTSMLSAVLDGFLHGALIKVPAGVTAIVPQRTTNTYADGVTFSGLSFKATGANTSATTGSMAKDTRVLTLAAAADFADGQVVLVRGAGPRGYLRGNGMRGTAVAGSAVITLAAQPNAASGVVVGQVLNIGANDDNSGGAFPAGSRVLSFVNDTGTSTYTITMSANAISTVAAPARIDLFGDIYGYIVSGGGTTTLNLTSMAHRAVTAAAVEHYDCAIFGTAGFRVERCTFEGFQGAAVAMQAGGRHISPDGTVTNANCYNWDGVLVRNGRNGVVIDGTDANACQFANIYTLTTSEWGIIDQSLLGNLFNNTHTAGGYGILHVTEPTSVSQFNYAYTESGTVNSFGSSASGLGTQSDDSDGGVRIVPYNGILGMPPQQVYPTEYSATYGQCHIGLRRLDSEAAGLLAFNLGAIGGSTSFQVLDSFRTGFLGVTDQQAGRTLFGWTMANHGLGPGHTLISSLCIGDGSEGAGSVTAGKYRRVLTGSAVPTAGNFAAGDIVLNNAGAGPFAWRCTAGGSPGAWAAVGGGAVTSQAGTAYTAALGDANGYVRFTSGSAVSFTVPPDSAVAFPIGTVIEVEQAGAGALSLAAGAGVTINARGSDLTLAGQFAVAALKKVGADSWTLTGDL